MKTNLKQANNLRETAAKLIKRAEELEAGIDRNKCTYGEYTNIPFKGCKTCGNAVRVICSHKKINPKIRNSGGCNPQNCIYHKPLNFNIKTI